MFGIRTGYLYLFGVTVIMVVMKLYVTSSSRFDFNTVTVDGRQVDADEARSLGLRTGESIFDQNLELVAEALSRREGIGQATVTRELPDRIRVKSNRFEAKYLIFDHETNSLRALNNAGLVAPLDSVPDNAIGPILLGIKNLELFEKPGDFRVTRVIQSLDRMRSRSEGWFAGISAIDFSSDQLLVFSFDNYQFQALVDPLTLDRALLTLETITEAQVEEALSSKIVNLLYEGLITLSFGEQQNLKSNILNKRVTR